MVKSGLFKQKCQIAINKRNNLHNVPHLDMLKIALKLLCFYLLEKENKNTLYLLRVMFSVGPVHLLHVFSVLDFSSSVYWVLSCHVSVV